MTDAVLSNLISAASGIVGAVIGGSFAVWGAIKAVEKTSQDLESTEIRRPEVMKNLRDFHAERNNERFIVLLRHLGSNTKLATGQLSDADFRTVTQLPLTGV